MFRGKVENIKYLFSKGAVSINILCLSFKSHIVISGSIKHICIIIKLQKGTNSKYELHRIEQAKRIIEPFMLRRLKADVLKSLPTKTVVINNVPMIEHQQTRYDTLTKEIKEASKNKETTENNHMMWLMMLRKLTNHPLLLRYHFEVSNCLITGNF